MLKSFFWFIMHVVTAKEIETFLLERHLKLMTWPVKSPNVNLFENVVEI